MQRLAVINLVGLTSRLLQSGHLPRLFRWGQRGWQALIQPAFPAVTCTAQANYLTGCLPAQHGIVGNGWYQRELAEVHFWKQSNHLVTAPKMWERLRQQHPGFTCAKLFWWFNMYSSADWSITPRPMYPADGRKIFDIYTWPYELKPQLKRDLGEFPFPTFWGPAAGVPSPQGPPDAASRWIAAAAQWIERQFQPHLHLIYLPHLDYNLQRHGPEAAVVQEDLRRVDEIAGELLDFFAGRGVACVVLSEYGLVPVEQPVHVNRVLRQEGWLVVKEELGRELLDAGACRAFAVADHQVAHIYVKNAGDISVVRRLLEKTPGVAQVLGPEELAACGLRHPRAGDLVAVAAARAWFTYYYWLDDARAPDFARTVDIHRKPGYDPVELFLNPALRFPRLKIGWRLLQKKLGFRMLMDVIPLEASLVRGSHGAIPAMEADYPVLLAPHPWREGPASLASTEVAAALADYCR
ncbi:MAG: alkaline phosphatase family protein [Verrucomicrobiae bacterium]|nr:alkaline phosphatase family protein [Verrucomicrobiae bacterium]